MAILTRKLSRSGCRCPRDAHPITWRSFHLQHRELEGALTRAVAFASITGLPG